MTVVAAKLPRLLVLGGAALWVLQLIWLAGHFAPEAGELLLRLRTAGAGPAQEAPAPLETWLASLLEVIPATATYILVDCYETGDYAKMGYALYPRRQIRLDPKVSPTRLYEEIKEHGATFVVVGGCQLPPPWDLLWQPPHDLFRPLLTTGLGQVYQIDPGRLIAGFYD
jgi:hypothetical protein